MESIVNKQTLTKAYTQTSILKKKKSCHDFSPILISTVVSVHHMPNIRGREMNVMVMQCTDYNYMVVNNNMHPYEQTLYLYLCTPYLMIDCLFLLTTNGKRL